MRFQIKTTVSIVSVLTALFAAGVAFWQATNASNYAEVSVKAALTSQRLETCIRINNNLQVATEQSSWSDFMEKPHMKNAHFATTVGAIHYVGEDAGLFRQMTPGQDAESFFTDVFDLRIKLKDMLVDGGDYLTKDEIRKAISELSRKRKQMCDKMIGPKGGFN